MSGLFEHGYPYTSAHELNLSWVILKVKELAEAWAKVQQDWTDEQAAFANLQSWIENYFNNLNVQTEINVKLDAMVAAGTMSELIAPYVASGLPAEVADQIGAVVASQIGPVVAAQISAVVADQLPAVAAAAAATEVSTWLAAHVNPETGYVIDDTFTVQGAAADAKAVGDEFTAIKSALTNVNNYLNTFDTSIFVNGGIINASGAVALTILYRVVTQNIQTATKDIPIKNIADGFECHIYTYSDAVGTSYNGYYKIKAPRMIIPKGTFYRLVIKRVTEDQSETANIPTFVNAVTFESDLGERLVYLENGLSDTDSLIATFPFNQFSRGAVANAVGTVVANDQRIVTTNIQTATNDIPIESVDSNFDCYLYTYSDAVGTSYLGYSKVTLPKTIAKGTYYRIVIQRKTEINNEIADVYSFCRKVVIRSEIGILIDDAGNELKNVGTVVNPGTIYITNVQQRIYFNEIFHTLVDGWYKVLVTSGVTYPEVTYTDRYVEFNVATSKTFGVTIQFYHKDTLALSVIISIVCNISAIPNKKYMFIGDSYTENGNIQGWFKDNNPSGVVTLYGTRGTAPYLNEGRSGWSVNDYFTNGKGGVTNPFYNPSTQTFDFSYYIANNPSFADVDVVNILLGRNNSWNTNALPYIKDMVDSILAYDNTIIVTVMCGSNVASNNSGMGRYLQNVYEDFIKKQNFNKTIKDYFTGYSNVRLVWQNTNLDNVYDFATEEVDCSIVNSEKVKLYTDNVHPSSSGYKKFGISYNGLMHNVLNA